MVVHVVILFGLEMWVMTPHIGRDLCIFQNRVAYWITERHPGSFGTEVGSNPLGGGDGGRNVGGGFGGGGDVRLEEEECGDGNKKH